MYVLLRMYYLPWCSLVHPNVGIVLFLTLVEHFCSKLIVTAFSYNIGL